MTTRISSPEATPEGIGTSSDSDVPVNMETDQLYIKLVNGDHLMSSVQCIFMSAH